MKSFASNQELKEVRLIATDMDRTLLTDEGELPPDFERYIHELDRLGIDFVIASGRPMYTLEGIFSKNRHKMSLISDNGAAVSHKGEMIFESLLQPEAYQSMIRFALDNTDGIPLICGLDAGYALKQHIEHEPFMRKFFAKLEFVDDITEVRAEANKLSIYFPNGDSKAFYESLFVPEFGKDYSVTLGGPQWLDLMNLGIDKGKGMDVLRERLGLESKNMMAFGDTYNDIEMLKAVKYSFVVANAEVEMREHASFIADSNQNYGVIKVLDEVLKVHRSND